MNRKEQFVLWSKVALQSFGGPAGQMAVVHRLVIEEKKLIKEDQFLSALNFCMLLPGPEAQQLVTYIGYLLGGWRGGVLAGTLFVLPGFLSILFISYVYVLFGDVSFVEGIFYGLRPAIIGIVLSSLYRLSQKSLTSFFYYAIALLSFAALFIFNLPFPLVVLGAALAGVFHYSKKAQTSEIVTKLPSPLTTIKTFFLWGGIWVTPIMLTFFLVGHDSTFQKINLFFSKMSMVTFGGAYAALSYVAQQGVNVYNWITAQEMLDALAMAETTPGPLIQSVQFVGFLASYRIPDMALNPYLSAFIGSFLTTWMTFAPCFLWIFLFAPYMEFLRGKKLLSNSLSAITAAVVGVILNLSLTFVLQVVIDFPSLAICLTALLLQFYFKKGISFILISSALLGVFTKFLPSLHIF